MVSSDGVGICIGSAPPCQIGAYESCNSRAVTGVTASKVAIFAAKPALGSGKGDPAVGLRIRPTGSTIYTHGMPFPGGSGESSSSREYVTIKNHIFVAVALLCARA